MHHMSFAKIKFITTGSKKAHHSSSFLYSLYACHFRTRQSSFHSSQSSMPQSRSSSTHRRQETHTTKQRQWEKKKGDAQEHHLSHLESAFQSLFQCGLESIIALVYAFQLERLSLYHGGCVLCRGRRQHEIPRGPNRS